MWGHIFDLNNPLIGADNTGHSGQYVLPGPQLLFIWNRNTHGQQRPVVPL